MRRGLRSRNHVLLVLGPGCFCPQGSRMNATPLGKVIVVGNSGFNLPLLLLPPPNHPNLACRVGKTNLLHRAVHGEWNKVSDATIHAVLFSTREVLELGNAVQLQFWDTGRLPH
jgi:hypothetical protein